MLRTLFSQSDALLHRYRHFWQRQPFYSPDLRQCDNLPQGLRQALNALSPDAFYSLSQDPEQSARWLSPWLTDAGALQELTRQIPKPAAVADNLFQPLATGIPGRKWQQIQQFSAQLQFSPATTACSQVLEWCAGKGHLGRLVALQHQQRVLSLEWQPGLCQQGEALVTQLQRRYPQLDQSFQQTDAHSPQALAEIAQSRAVVALHACGDLHTRLIRHSCQLSAAAAPATPLPQLAIAPCCYHLTADKVYQPLSQAGQRSALSLSRQDLKIPLQETVTGGRRIERLRDQELHWRLSFDSLRQQITGTEGYQPLPGFKKQLLSGSFADFVRWAVVNRQLASPEQLEQAECSEWLQEATLQQALQNGQARLLNVRKLEWLQRPFRRVLELWLVLDRALALEEAGFHVELRRFCDKTITPRNLLILARGND